MSLGIRSAASKIKLVLSPIRNAMNRTTAPLPLLCNACNMSGTSSNQVSPIYELRIYKTAPKDLKAAYEVFLKYKDVRTSHSELFGYWTAEIGDCITQFVHIWKYESLSQRRQVRTNMANDETWTKEFIPQFMPRLQSWDNALIATVPGSEVNTNFVNDSSAVYILEKVAKPVSLTPEPVTIGDKETLVGRFCGLLGSTNTEYRLWRYSDIDAATEASFKRAVDTPSDGKAMLMYPATFSPIQ